MTPNFKKTLAWVTVASALTFAAFWQAKTTLKHEQIKSTRAILTPPLRTRHALRTEKIPRTPSEAHNDYITRHQQGLSDAEINWILDDFKSAGLDQRLRAAPAVEYLEQRKAQDRWLHHTLVEAWGLNPEQSTQVRAKLNELYQQAESDFLESIDAETKPIQIDGKWYRITSSDPIYQLINVSQRIADIDSPYMPWKLCQLPSEFSNPETPRDLSDPNLLIVNLMLPPLPPTQEIQDPPISGESKTHLPSLHPAQLKLLLLINHAAVK